MALPALRAGDPSEAGKHWRAASTALTGNPNNICRMGHLLFYLAAAGSHEPARTLLQRNLPWLEGNPTPYDRMIFCAGAAAACRMLVTAGCPPLSLAMPAAWRAAHGEAPAAPADLSEWFAAEAGAIAAAFNQRNGNTYCSTLLTDLSTTVDECHRTAHSHASSS
jgi:hypothetical protein